MKSRAVFLDRDGVINQSIVKDGKPYPPATLEELVILPQVSEALFDLKAKGYLLIVATNQPDVAKGKTTFEEVQSLNEYLMQNLPIDEIKICFHVDEHHCSCRKPQPGMLFDAAHQYQIDLSKSYMIGDRWRDVEAGKAAGCQTFWIDYHYEEKRPTQYDFKVNSLYEATLIIK